MIDLTKLSPAPWLISPAAPAVCKPSGYPLLLSSSDNITDLVFAALARNAFDVMLCRGWSPCPCPIAGHGWRVDTNKGHYFAFDRHDMEGVEPAEWPDPYTALVEADAWMKQQEAPT